MSPTTRDHSVVLFLMAGFCVAMSGCSNPARDRMIGKWEATFEMTEEDMSKMTATDNPIVSGLGKLLMKKLRAEIEWEFAADGTVIVSPTFLGNTVTRQGKWQFLRGDEKTTTIQFTFENDSAREVSFDFTDPDTFEAVPMASAKWQLNRAVKFKRVAGTP